MRPGQQKQRSRGRSNNSGSNHNNNNNQRKGQNPLTRTYDSSGPDVKIRGTAQHIAEKYMALARDATSAGDRVMAENYLQHAEHYNRIIAAAQAMYQERFQRDDRQDFSERDDDDTEASTPEPVAQVEAPAPQPVVEQKPVVVIDDQTPQPVFEATPAEVQIEQETTAHENAEPTTSRRRSSGRPRRTPRQPKAAAAAANAEAAPAEAREAAEEPAE